MLKALIFSFILATTSLTSNAFAANSAPTQQQVEYIQVVKELGEARYIMIEMIANIGLRSDREKAIELFKQANSLYKTLSPVPTQLDVAKINAIVVNFQKIEFLYKLHFGKRYVEI